MYTIIENIMLWKVDHHLICMMRPFYYGAKFVLWAYKHGIMDKYDLLDLDVFLDLIPSYKNIYSVYFEPLDGVTRFKKRFTKLISMGEEIANIAGYELIETEED